MRRSLTVVLALTGLISGLFGTTPAAATVASTIWTGTDVSMTIGSWTDPGNWDNGVPSAGMDVVIAPASFTTIQDVPDVTVHDLTLNGSGAGEGVILVPSTTATVAVTGTLHWTHGKIFEGLTLELASGATGLADPSIDAGQRCVLQGQLKVDVGATFEVRTPGTAPTSPSSIPFQVGAPSTSAPNGRIVVQGELVIDDAGVIGAQVTSGYAATIEVDGGGTIVAFGPDPVGGGVGTAGSIVDARVVLRSGSTISATMFPMTGTVAGNLQFLGATVKVTGPGSAVATGGGGVLFGPGSTLALTSAELDLSGDVKVVLGSVPVGGYSPTGIASVVSKGSGDAIRASAPDDGGTVRARAAAFSGTGLTVSVPTTLMGAYLDEVLTLAPATLGPHTLSGTVTIGSLGGAGTLRVAKGAVLKVSPRTGATTSTLDVRASSKVVDAGTVRLFAPLTLEGDGSFGSPGTLWLGTARLSAGSVSVAIPGTVRSTLEHSATSGWTAGRIAGGAPVNVDNGSLVVSTSGTGSPSAGTKVTLIKAATSLVGRFALVSLPPGWSLSRTPTTLSLVG